MEAGSERLERPARGELKVGEWLVAPDLNQLARGDEVVQIEPKAMAVLVYLARRPGEVASREELLAAVWPGVIVGDNALTQVVIKLRKALGDIAREPTYVQAISKKGYRLIAKVGGPDGEWNARPPDYASATRPRNAVQWAAAALVAVMLAAAAAWFLQPETEPDAPPLNAEVRSDSSVSAAFSTVIVKPFEAFGEDPQQSLFARAITADLVTDLSKVSGLWIASGTGPDDQSTPVSGSASARYLVSGSVQREGNRLRLHVRLVDLVTNRQLWSERFDRDVKDLFSVQDDFVRHIIAVLPIKLGEAETLRLAQRYTRDLVAYEYFQRGQAALLVRRRPQNELARELYWKAINADPAFARAYAGLAMTYALEYQLGWAGAPALVRALEFAETAVQMTPDLPETQWALGFVHAQRRQHELSLRYLDRALSLNPSYGDAYAMKAGVLTYVGRPAETVPLMRTALRLNPDAGALYFMVLGRAYYFLGDSEQARVNLDQALQRNPENLEARIYKAATHWLAGERDAAVWQVSEIRTLEPRFNVHTWLASYPMTDAGQKQQLVGALEAMGL
jgi:DNA-binding winged helix-turn-helix (wHTH) protein/TolB-like protein/Tfp pilus assembly protein PilF